MIKTTQIKIAVSALLALFSSYTLSHGLMVNPPARNAVCGLPEDQKPHNASNPACIDAFANDRDGGYQFMSVLTHDVGRKGVSPLPENVCGFDSETWDNKNNFTPWDVATDWPTTSISSGPLDIIWNISWGPHFDDTEEFVYYITKPDFQFQVGVPLSWDDFESTPFCDLRYDDSNPGANPNVVSDVAAATFVTRCNVPARSGRHVIYGEWGRNYFTYERFHGCMDVSFGGGGGGGGGEPVNRAPTANAQALELAANGRVDITLSGSDSDGTVVGYAIARQPANGQLSGSGANRRYTPNSGFSGSDSFTFTVRDDDGAVSAAATVSIQVNAEPSGNQAPNAAFSYSASDLSVNFDASASSDPDSGPQTLSYSWNFGDGTTASGRTASHSYSTSGSYDVTLSVSDGADSDQATQTVAVNSGGGGGGGNAALKCEYIISNSWNSGFVAEVRLMNNGDSTVNGWEVSWNYSDGSAFTNGWSANFSGSGPYTASNLGWNASIEPGQTVTFGFQGTHNGNSQVPTVTGDKCD